MRTLQAIFCMEDIGQDIDQGKDLYPISLSIPVTCLLNNVWKILGEVTFQSLIRVKGLFK